MNSSRNQVRVPRYRRINTVLKILLVFWTVTVTTVPLLLGQSQNQSAPAPSPQKVTLSGTLHLYLVANYGDKMQEVDRYRETGEGSMIAFILKTDKKIDMIQYLDKEGIEALKDYAGTTLQSEFMIVPDWEVFESFSGKDFAAQYAHKRVRMTGTLLCPMAGWRNITLVRLDFSKVEVIE